MREKVAASVALSLCVLSGCVRAPVNDKCEWPSEKPLVLDPSSSEGRRHLVADAQLAEGLAVRFADSEHGRLTGFSGHGGLIENGRVVNECMATLFNTIVSTHQVPMEQVLASRTVRPLLFDFVIFLSFAIIYALVAWAMVSIVLRRFSPDGPRLVLGALLFASLVAGAAGLQVGELWAVTMEMIRLGNDHLGRRGLRIPWGQHRAVILGVGIGLFWVVAALRLWVAHRSHPKLVSTGHAV